MKKLLSLFALLVVSSLLFTACGGSDDDFQDDAETITLEGVLEEQVEDDGFTGTHTIAMDNGEIFPLRSVAINLSDPSYLGNRVQVFAVLNSADGVYSVTGLSVLEKLSDADKEVELLEFKDSDLGFKVSYYSDWELTAGGSVVEFKSPFIEEDADDDQIDVITINQFTFAFSKSVFDTEGIDTPLLNFVATEFPEIKEIDSHLRSIGADSYEALMIEGDDGNINYYTYRNGLMYHIAFEPFSEDSESKMIFNEMLATFKLIGFTVDSDDEGGVGVGAVIPETDEDSGSTTVLPSLDVNFTFFESLPYSFRAQYPESWYYAGASSPDSDVLHHYGFNNDVLEDGNELISLDVVSGATPAGKSLSVSGFDLIKVSSAGEVLFYTTVDDQSYRIAGPSDQEDLMLVMITSIEKVEREED